MIQARLALVAVLAFASMAFWRLALAFGHYRKSLAMVDVPSAKELEQASLILEAGLGAILLLHAGAAALLMRRPLRVEAGTVVGVFALVGILTVSSLQRFPALGAPGILPIGLTLAGICAGVMTEAPWLSAYLGTLLGSLVGAWTGAPGLDPIIAAAVVIPALAAVLIGVTLGRLTRRLYNRGAFGDSPGSTGSGPGPRE